MAAGPGPVHPLAGQNHLPQPPHADGQPLEHLPGAANAAHLGRAVLVPEDGRINLIPENGAIPPEGEVGALEADVDIDPVDDEPVHAVDVDAEIPDPAPAAVDAFAGIPEGRRRRNIQVFATQGGESSPPAPLTEEKQNSVNRTFLATETYLINLWHLDPNTTTITISFDLLGCEYKTADNGPVSQRSIRGLDAQGQALIDDAYTAVRHATGTESLPRISWDGTNIGNANGDIPFSDNEDELLKDLSSNANEFLEHDLASLLALVIPQNHANTQLATSTILKRVAVSEVFRELLFNKIGTIIDSLKRSYDSLTNEQKNTQAGESIRRQIEELNKLQFELKKIKSHAIYNALGFRPIYDHAQPAPAQNLPLMDIFGNQVTPQFLKARARAVKDSLVKSLNEKVPVYQQNQKNVNPEQILKYAQEMGGQIFHANGPELNAAGELIDPNGRITPLVAQNAFLDYFAEENLTARQMSKEMAFFVDDVIHFNEETPVPADPAVDPARDAMRARFQELFMGNPQIRVGDAMQPLYDQVLRLAAPAAPQPGAPAPALRLLQANEEIAQGEQLQVINIRQQLDQAFNETFDQARRILGQNIVDAASMKAALYQAGQGQQQNQQQPNQAPLVLPHVRPLLQPPKSGWEKFKGWFQRKAPVNNR